ncbi:hypothetical protein OKW37_005753 [Paraburkholderia sp. MM5482-R2]
MQGSSEARKEVPVFAPKVTDPQLRAAEASQCGMARRDPVRVENRGPVRAPPEDALHLQRAIGNQATLRLLATRNSPNGAEAPILQRQSDQESAGVGNVGSTGVLPQDDSIATQADSGQTTTPKPGSCIETFLNQGSGLTGKPLGPTPSAAGFLYGIEIQFRFDSTSFPTIGVFRPAQWAGPQAVWVKTGNPITSTWANALNDPAGSGPDDPLPQAIFRGPGVVAFYDSPGPILTSLGKPGFSRYVAMANFTASVKGDPSAGGQAQRVCQDIAWHYIVSLGNENWTSPTATPRWTFIAGTEAGVGWVDINNPPAV